MSEAVQSPQRARSGASKIQGIDDFPDEAPSTNQLAVYVYETPVRVWHWINALAIFVLIATGLFIHKPPFSLMGEASEHYLMGTVRAVHFAAGYVAGFGFVARAVYALFSKSHHAKQLFAPPLLSKHFWAGVMHELRWYFFLEKEPKKYVGHNPMAQLAMFFLFTTMMTVMTVTGFALFGEGAGEGHWSHFVFTSWVLPLVGGNSLTLHTIHHLGMWMIVIFCIVHIYAAIREDVMSRQSLVSTMISGWRMFKDNRP
jgi:Ni/Fe-hydrogenase 1 B-type cytochrome subunit